MTTICLDFDGVLAYYTKWDGKIGKPNPEGVKLARMLKAEGFEIVIQSCRWHTDFEDSSSNSHKVIMWLLEHNIPFDKIEYGSKALADIYVDDRAIHFPLNQGPAKEVYEKIISRISHGSTSKEIEK